MKKFFYIIPIMLGLILTSCYDKDIEEIKNRLDTIEGTHIASLQQQISAIKSTLPELEKADKELKGYISTLQETASDLQKSIDNTNTKIEEVKITLQNETSTAKTEILAQLTSFKTDMETELTQIKATITTLQIKDAELEQKITDLQSYVNTELANNKDWINATFATLEQYNALVSDIATIKVQITNIITSITELETTLKEKIDTDIATAVSTLNSAIGEKVEEITTAYTTAISTTKEEITTAYTTDIATAISTLELSMKEWINEQLTGYYTIAEVEGKLEALQNTITESDKELKKEIEELSTNLTTTKSEMTTAYKNAIQEAIEENNGVIDGKIATAITEVNLHIDTEVARIDAKILEIETRLDAIEEELDKLLSRHLDITFDVDSNLVVAPNYTYEIGYSVTSSTDDAVVEVVSSADIKAKVVANGLNGKIVISTSDTVDEYSKVVVLVANGEKAIMRSITFEQAAVQISDTDTKTIPIEGGTVELAFLTNVECNVVIPSEAASWLSVVPATRALEKHIITLQATANDGLTRSTTVKVVSIDGNLSVEYIIHQESKISIINYTTNDGNPLDIYTTEGFGADLIENAYDATSGKGTLTFNGKVNTIPATAFVACRNLTWIDIPDSIVKIGDRAFNGCTAIEQITIPSSVTSIGTSAFENCGGKATIECKIGDSSSYSGGKFYNAKFTEVTLGNNITSIGDYAFYGCSSLASVTIPDSVTSIGEAAFSYCSNLTEVYTDNLSAWCKISFNNSISNPLYNGAKLYIDNKEVTDITIPSDITEIKDDTFCGCTSLTSITIHNRVTTIGNYVFYRCSNLTSVTIPDRVTEIGSSAFDGCSNLTSVTIGNSVAKIGANAFLDCSNLTSVTIPDSVIEIGYQTFRNCI